MLLHHGEKVVLQAGAVMSWGGRDIGGGLYLTNVRFVFEEQIPGGFRRSAEVRTLTDVRLENIRNAQVTTARFGKPSLLVEAGKARASYTVLNPSQWVETLISLRSQRLASRSSGVQNAPNVTVNVHTPAAPPVVKFPCPYCKVPQPSDLAKCESCGAPLR